jgi:hypothetical protein
MGGGHLFVANNIKAKVRQPNRDALYWKVPFGRFVGF